MVTRKPQPLGIVRAGGSAAIDSATVKEFHSTPKSQTAVHLCNRLHHRISERGEA